LGWRKRTGKGYTGIQPEYSTEDRNFHYEQKQNAWGLRRSLWRPST
jgi:hypothetical protein